MSRLSAPLLALAGVMALGLVASSAITITPASHDFGQVTVNAMVTGSFRIAVPIRPNSTWTPDVAVTLSLAGPDAADFQLEEAPHDFLTPGDILPRSMVRSTDFMLALCIGPRSPQAIACDQRVYFVPTSIGPKSATLVATDPDGIRATAQLKGEGIFGCVMKVVPCNYANPYSGTFGWISTLNGPASQHKENVQVNVMNGVATCSGAATEVAQGQSRIGPITGPGLIAVEFEPDPMYPVAYRITAACPTPAWPADPANGVPATPSQPAELGHNDQNSQKQPATAVGMKLLEGTITYPSPDTDPLNGVTGDVSISWKHKRP